MKLALKLGSYVSASTTSGVNIAYLCEDNWDDYSFKSKFFLIVYDESGNRHEIGSIKVGAKNFQKGWVKDLFPKEDFYLIEDWFSLGQDENYYLNIRKNLSAEFGNLLLSALRDVAFDDNILQLASSEEIFRTSLLRSVSLATIKGQFRRILEGKAPLTEFKFSYNKPRSDRSSEVNLTFEVTPHSKPSTNIHVLIGRNGVGKTTVINNIVSSVINEETDQVKVGSLSDLSPIGGSRLIAKDFFSSISSISFSAFDPFIPPENRIDRSLGTCYFYIGLKNNQNEDGSAELKGQGQLRAEFVESISLCFSITSKKDRWLKAIRTLESDSNFAEMNLGQLVSETNLKETALQLVSRMSSGHTIVLLTMTKLIETVEEKTLVLMDEPESHLHPPLLSAFTRALSDLLIERNAIAIIATHSPVVLQEVPKSCVWKLERSRLVGKSFRPESETFGENVGVLTREVFGLEVAKSGYHDLLIKSVNEGLSYEAILEKYNGQVGYEGKAVLRALLAERDGK